MKTRKVAYGALFVALTAILSQVVIPLPFSPVPINLAVLSVLLCGGIMGASWGAFSMAVYVLLGAIGVPVFAGFTGGAGIVAGMTGGYIIGYIIMAWLCGSLISKWNNSFGFNIVAMCIGLAALYLFGTMWFMVVTKSTFWVALLSCVIPFLPGDAVKILLAAYLVKRLKKVVHI